MQKDHIRTLKILQSVSEFGGLWKHRNRNPACIKSAKSLQSVKAGHSHVKNWIMVSFAGLWMLWTICAEINICSDIITCLQSAYFMQRFFPMDWSAVVPASHLQTAVSLCITAILPTCHIKCIQHTPEEVWLIRIISNSNILASASCSTSVGTGKFC